MESQSNYNGTRCRNQINSKLQLSRKMNHQFKSLEKPKNNAFLKEDITLVVECYFYLVT